MKLIGVTQKVVVDLEHQEKRDALDQRWSSFLLDCGYTPYPIPNRVDFLDKILTLPFRGIILTGGNTIGTDALERDALETRLLKYASTSSLPLFGVCRGMQMILKHFGGQLQVVDRHANQPHFVAINGTECVVNSYHHFGALSVPKPLEVTARARDGVIEAIKHTSLPIEGVMWHPERTLPIEQRDKNQIQALFL